MYLTYIQYNLFDNKKPKIIIKEKINDNDIIKKFSLSIDI